MTALEVVERIALHAHGSEYAADDVRRAAVEAGLVERCPSGCNNLIEHGGSCFVCSRDAIRRAIMFETPIEAEKALHSLGFAGARVEVQASGAALVHWGAHAMQVQAATGGDR